MRQTRFTNEFHDEAAPLVVTMAIAGVIEAAQDLGIGLSGLRHWIDRRREREVDHLLKIARRIWPPN